MSFDRGKRSAVRFDPVSVDIREAIAQLQFAHNALVTDIQQIPEDDHRFASVKTQDIAAHGVSIVKYQTTLATVNYPFGAWVNVDTVTLTPSGGDILIDWGGLFTDVGAGGTTFLRLMDKNTPLQLYAAQIPIGAGLSIQSSFAAFQANIAPKSPGSTRTYDVDILPLPVTGTTLSNRFFRITELKR